MDLDATHFADQLASCVARLRSVERELLAMQAALEEISRLADTITTEVLAEAQEWPPSEEQL